METVSVRFLDSDVDMHIITACEDTDTCPGCGAGYKAGLIECEYCRRPVRLATGGMEPRDMLAIVHPGETIIPKAWA